jgi:hypothetical protein
MHFGLERKERQVKSMHNGIIRKTENCVALGYDLDLLFNFRLHLILSDVKKLLQRNKKTNLKPANGEQLEGERERET